MDQSGLLQILVDNKEIALDVAVKFVPTAAATAVEECANVVSPNMSFKLK